MFKGNKHNPVIKIIATKDNREYEFYTDYDVEIKGTDIFLHSIKYDPWSGSKRLAYCKTSVKELENTFDSIHYEYKRRDRVWNSITS